MTIRRRKSMYCIVKDRDVPLTFLAKDRKSWTEDHTQALWFIRNPSASELRTKLIKEGIATAACIVVVQAWNPYLCPIYDRNGRKVPMP
jgi:hypothetical protein